MDNYATAKDKSRLQRIIRTAEKVIGCNLHTLEDPGASKEDCGCRLPPWTHCSSHSPNLHLVIKQSLLSRATYSKSTGTFPPKTSSVMCLAQGQNAIFHGQESNQQPSD